MTFGIASPPVLIETCTSPFILSRGLDAKDAMITCSWKAFLHLWEM